MTTSMTEMLTLERLDEAAQLASRSGILTFKTGAVIYSPLGTKIANGWSHYSDFKLTQYRSIHAELHAVLRTNLKTKLQGSTVYVATIKTRNGKAAMTSRPCSLCTALLKEAGFKQAIYTTSTGYDIVSFSQ